MAHDLQKKQNYSNPVAIFGTDYAVLQSFFQYFFPPQRLSAQSWGLHESMTESQKDELFSKMLTTVEMTDQDICFTTFLVPDYRNDLPTIQQMGLADSTFICDRRKGFSQITPGTKFRNTEHKLTALSRRLRDAFGHARIGAYGDYVLFEDQSENHQKGTTTITGRIVLKNEDLKTWKYVIEKYITDNGIPIT